MACQWEGLSERLTAEIRRIYRKTLRSLEVSIYEYEKLKKEYPLDINAANRGFFEVYPPPRTDILKPNQGDSIGFVGKTPVGMFL